SVRASARKRKALHNQVTPFSSAPACPSARRARPTCCASRKFEATHGSNFESHRIRDSRFTRQPDGGGRSAAGGWRERSRRLAFRRIYRVARGVGTARRGSEALFR